ncbi:MAG: glycosyl hydrolase family 18 protein [Xenococcus sp. (in: cyanobacteria)]
MNLKRFFAFVLAIPLVFLTLVPGSWAAESKIVEYVDSPLPDYFPPEVVVDDILSTAGYVNEINISFWTQSNGPQGAALEWVKGTFGDTLYAVNRFHDAGINVLIAAGGALEAPVTNNPYDGYDYGFAVAQFALENNFDGIDFDIENIAPGNPEGTAAWLAQATLAVKDVYPSAIISHAPQAPYFSPAQGYGYLELNDYVGDLIDHYNIQFYNQGNEAYDTYEELFLFSDPFYQPETSVLEIAQNGVPLEKIVIGKPITPSDAYNSGYVLPEDLNEFICQGTYDGLQVGGVMGWQWTSDYDEQYQGTYPWSILVSDCLY